MSVLTRITNSKTSVIQIQIRKHNIGVCAQTIIGSFNRHDTNTWKYCMGVCSYAVVYWVYLYRYGSPDGQSDMHDILCHSVFKIPIKIKIQIHSYAKKKWYTFLFYSIEWLPIALIKSWLLSVWPRCKYLPYFSGYYFLRSRHPPPSFYPDPTSVNPPVQPLCISASSAMQLWCRKMYILKQNAKPPEKNLHFCFRANCPGTFFTTLEFFKTL